MEKNEMTCHECGATMRTRREVVPFDEAIGLPGVRVETLVARCPKCGAYEVIIPNLEGLHTAIATMQAAIAKADRILEIDPGKSPETRSLETPHKYHPRLRQPLGECSAGFRDRGRPPRRFRALTNAGISIASKRGPAAQVMQRVLQEADRIAGKPPQRVDPEKRRDASKLARVDFASKWKRWLREYRESEEFRAELLADPYAGLRDHH